MPDVAKGLENAEGRRGGDASTSRIPALLSRISALISVGASVIEGRASLTERNL
jgi:hypothetical protein